MSAFAARRATRATQNPLAEAAGENVVNANSTTLPLKESYRPSPAKRRKINGKTGYWASGNDLSPSASAKFAQLQAEPKFAGKILESENERSYSGDETDDLSSRLVPRNLCAIHLLERFALGPVSLKCFLQSKIHSNSSSSPFPLSCLPSTMC